MDQLVPETRVLAVASHVSAKPRLLRASTNVTTGRLRVGSPIINSTYRDLPLISTCSHVGNTMATFVMQSLGCEVAALNTVHFSTLRCNRSIGIIGILTHANRR